MVTYNKIYKGISIGNAVLHGLLVIFVLGCGFLPFRGEENFYQVFSGSFGTKFPAIEPAFVLLPLIAAGVFSVLSIRHPAFSFGSIFFSLAYPLLLSLPMIADVVVGIFSTPWWMGATEPANPLPKYQLGSHLLANVSYLFYWELAFAVYAFVILLFRRQDKQALLQPSAPSDS